MSFLQALRASAAGLTAQRTRMNLISQNLANIETTRTETGEPYRRKDVVFAAGQAPGTFAAELSAQAPAVRVAEVMEDPRPFPARYEPGHPDADAAGYVQLPNVELVEEMANLVSAVRSYEANVAAATASRRMAATALDIGR
ncbi:MAG: flagellar basal body rod protein FlgC [Desulfococcaceae bacterium]